MLCITTDGLRFVKDLALDRPNNIIILILGSENLKRATLKNYGFN